MSPRRARAVAGFKGDAAVALREHLIDTTEQLLSERELGAITTRELAAAAEVSDGVLYNYFADKNDLLLTALVRRFTQLVAKLISEIPEPGTGTIEHNLERLAEALLEFHLAAVPLFGKLVAEPQLLRRFMADIHHQTQPFGGKQIRDAVRSYLEEERRNGRVIGDAGAAADLLIGAIALLALNRVLGLGTRAELTERLRTIVDLLIRGVGQHDAQEGAP